MKYCNKTGKLCQSSGCWGNACSLVDFAFNSKRITLEPGRLLTDEEYLYAKAKVLAYELVKGIKS